MDTHTCHILKPVAEKIQYFFSGRSSSKNPEKSDFSSQLVELYELTLLLKQKRQQFKKEVQLIVSIPTNVL